MPTSDEPYPKELRRKIVDLYDDGRSVAELADEFEPSEETIRDWIDQDARESGDRDDDAAEDVEGELKRLRAEYRRVKEERDILKKAKDWFGDEGDDTTDDEPSDS